MKAQISETSHTLSCCTSFLPLALLLSTAFLVMRVNEQMILRSMADYDERTYYLSGALHQENRFLSLVWTAFPSPPFTAAVNLCSDCCSVTNSSCRTRPSKVPGNGKPIVLRTVGTRSKISA